MAGSMEEETWPIEASMGIKDITRLWALSSWSLYGLYGKKETDTL